MWQNQAYDCIWEAERKHSNIAWLKDSLWVLDKAYFMPEFLPNRTGSQKALKVVPCFRNWQLDRKTSLTHGQETVWNENGTTGFIGWFHSSSHKALIGRQSVQANKDTARRLDCISVVVGFETIEQIEISANRPSVATL